MSVKIMQCWGVGVNDKLVEQSLAQLVERCTDIAEVMGSNPVRAWIFFSGPIYNYSFQ